MILNEILWNNVVVASLIFLVIVLVLTIILLLAKSWLVNSGEVAISINDGAKLLHAPAGKSLLATLNDNGTSGGIRTQQPPLACVSRRLRQWSRLRYNPYNRILLPRTARQRHSIRLSGIPAVVVRCRIPEQRTDDPTSYGSHRSGMHHLGTPFNQQGSSGKVGK